MRLASFGSLFAAALAGIAACSDATSAADDFYQLPLPSVDVRSTSVDSGGVLRISVSVANSTQVPLRVFHSPQCSFGVRIFPDPAAQLQVATGASCPSGARATDLLPGDSLILSRIFSSADLTQYAPGLYGINVTVRTNTTIAAGWGGLVMLPLRSKP